MIISVRQSPIYAQYKWDWARASIQLSAGDGFEVRSVACDRNRYVYITGIFYDTSEFAPFVIIPPSKKRPGGFITKYDLSGNVVWSKSLYYYPNTITIDNSGNIYTSSEDTLQRHCFLTKYDSAGNMAWQRANNSNTCFIALDNSGNPFLFGTYQDTSYFGSVTLISTRVGGYAKRSVFIAQYDSYGNLKWAKSSKNIGTGDANAINIATDNFGNVIVASYVEVNGGLIFDTDTVLSSYDIYAAKLDSIGNIQWLKSPGHSGGFPAIGYKTLGLAVDDSGNIYMSGGYSIPSIYFDTIKLTNTSTTGTVVLDGFIVKLDPSGNVLWAKNMGGNDDNYTYDITVDAFGNIWTSGYFSDDAVFDTLHFHSTTIGEASFLARYTSDGILDYATYLESGGTLHNYLTTDNEGDIFLSAYYETPGPHIERFVVGSDTLPDYHQNAFVAKLTPYSPDSGTIVKSLTRLDNFKIYPNPANNTIQLKWTSESKINGYSYTIMDNIGRALLRGTLKNPIAQVNISELQPGTYFIEIMAADDKIVKKFVKK